MGRNDSESEDCPRNVLGVRDDGWFRFSDIWTSADVERATQAAGNGAHGVWTATTFAPPSDLPISGPDDIFAPRLMNASTGQTPYRFMLRRRHVPALSNLKTMAIFTDGACSDNGAIGTERVPRAGCAFIFKPGQDGTVSFPLEQQGPANEIYSPTSNRAELRAALAALQFRFWSGEGWKRIVLITDSEYVAVHATQSLRRWAERAWTTSSGRQVKNQDLWKVLSDQIGELARHGCEVSFWRVPRCWNVPADAAAKAAVGIAEVRRFIKTLGTVV